MQDLIRDRVEQLMRTLASAANNRALYGENHKITRDAVDNLCSILDSILKERESIIVGIVGSEMVFEDEPFYDLSKHIAGFIAHLKKMKAEKLSFCRGIGREEVLNFVTILTMREDTLEEGGLARLFASFDIKNIAFGEIRPGKEEEEPESDTKKDYDGGLDFFEKTYADFHKNKFINMESARQLASSIIKALLKDRGLLLILTSTKSHDESTFVHDINVAVFTLLQADALGLEQHYLHDIGTAALLHDSGKLSIPPDILRKREGLSEAEMNMIKKHPINGAKILLETPGISMLAAIGAFEHHVGYDMQGYPEKVYKKNSNLVSMMISVADYYDALRSKRHYREEMTPEKTYDEMMRLSGKVFHPDLLNNFFSIVGVFPPGTLVELDTGEIGIVVRASAADIKRPQMEILYDKNGKKEEKPRIVNLMTKDEAGSYKRSIVKSIIASEKIKIPEKYL